MGKATSKAAKGTKATTVKEEDNTSNNMIAEKQDSPTLNSTEPAADAAKKTAAKDAKFFQTSIKPNGKSSSQTLQFPWKLHEMLRVAEEQGKDDVISWLPEGRGFRVHKKDEFCETIMPIYFSSQKYKTFQRSLNLWGFESISKGPNRGACFHECFVKGQPQLCHSMTRIKVKGKATGNMAPVPIINATNMNMMNGAFMQMSQKAAENANGGAANGAAIASFIRGNGKNGAPDAAQQQQQQQAQQQAFAAMAAQNPQLAMMNAMASMNPAMAAAAMGMYNPGMANMGFGINPAAMANMMAQQQAAMQRQQQQAMSMGAQNNQAPAAAAAAGGAAPQAAAANTEATSTAEV